VPGLDHRVQPLPMNLSSTVLDSSCGALVVVTAFSSDRFGIVSGPADLLHCKQEVMVGARMTARDAEAWPRHGHGFLDLVFSLL
jgi:hypothetical protein